MSMPSAPGARAPATAATAIPASRFEVWAFAACAVLGFTFWFVIGFPFANHNESYHWLVRLDSDSLWSAMTGRFATVSGLRPLGTAAAWLTYHAGGRTTVVTQLLNLALAWTAWGLLAGAVRQRRTFALLGLVTGGVFFAGYLYLFHLHGVFYGFALIWLAAAAAQSLRGISPGRLQALALGAWVTALFHPHALMLLVAFLGGALLEFRSLRTRGTFSFVALALITTLVEMVVLVPREVVVEVTNRFHGMLTAYRTVELQPAISVFAAAVATLAAWSIRAPLSVRGVLAALVLVAAWTLFASGLPVLLLWPIVCLIKAARHRRWTIGAMLAMSCSFAYISPTGSPTYTVFEFMLCALVTALDWDVAEARLATVPARAAVALVAVTLALALITRAGVPVPVLSRLAQPLLAERERTHQMETLIDWYLASPYRPLRVRFFEEARSPSRSETAIDRRYRPPTQNNNLTSYLASRRGAERPNGPFVVVAFGGEPVPGGRPIHRLPGRWAGPAEVYLSDTEPGIK